MPSLNTLADWIAFVFRQVFVFMKKEIESWEEVSRYPKSYVVSNKGNIGSLNYKGKKGVFGLMSMYFRKDKYVTVTLSNNGTAKTVAVHILVAEAFIPNPEKKPQVNHKDGNKHNNNVSNLEWATKSEDITHAYSNNLRKVGEKSHLSKLTKKQVLEIRDLMLNKNADRTEVAKLYGINVKTVWRIKNNKTWKHS